MSFAVNETIAKSSTQSNTTTTNTNYTSNTSPPLQVQDTIEPIPKILTDQNLERLVEILRTPVPVTPGALKLQPPVVVKDRLYRFRRYKECFVARDLVQALLTLGYCQTRRDAVVVGKRLTRRGQIHHVVDDHDFRDGYYFFRWYADDLKIARSLSVRRASSTRERNGSVSPINKHITGGGVSGSGFFTSGSSRGRGSTDRAKSNASSISNSTLKSLSSSSSINLSYDVSAGSTATLKIQEGNEFEGTLDGNTNNNGQLQPSRRASFGGIRDIGPLASLLRRGVAIRDRSYHGKIYFNCFLGKDAVTWLVESDACESREEACVLGSAMVTAGYFHHVVDDHVLKDGHLFYRFYQDEEEYVAERANGKYSKRRSGTRMEHCS